MYRSQLKNIQKDLHRLAEESLHEIIRYGEFDPTDRVLDMVLEVLVKNVRHEDIVNDAYDGDTLVSQRIVELHFSSNGDSLEAINKFNRRSKQLLREHAARYLEGIEDRIWALWHDQAVPAEGYI